MSGVLTPQLVGGNYLPEVCPLFTENRREIVFTIPFVKSCCEPDAQASFGIFGVNIRFPDDLSFIEHTQFLLMCLFRNNTQV